MFAPDTVVSLDRHDPLKLKRDEFLLPSDTIYMDGNSLGALPKQAKDRVAKVVEQQWGNDLIHSWNKHHWIDLPLKVGDKIAALIGAEKGQVIACDSTSVNLFKVLASALKINSQRHVVLSQRDNFPTDLYMVQGMSEFLGDEACQLKSVSEELLLESLDESVAVLMLTQVNFRSGRLHDMQSLTKRAHEKGVLVVWDLAHSAGALEISLDKCEVDFAVGCGYKYLNGGPGAPAFIYAAKRHHPYMTQPLSGWMGHARPFEFEHDYHAGEAMLRFLAGTPNILSLVVLDAALEVFSQVDMAELRTKSLGLTELFINCVDSTPSLSDFELLSPRNKLERGSQVAYSHPDAFAISQALIAHKVVVDFRAPNIIRFGFTPLYLSYQDVWSASQVLIKIVEEQLYLEPKYNARSKVT
ncbi:MAG: kynureninase [Arenicella sp.]|jgi:kynureninase